MRKTIYVPSEEVWGEVSRKAKAMGMSVSKYLLGEYHMANESQLDRIESKLDKALKAHDTVSSDGGKPIGDDIEMLAKKQAELDAKRRGRNPKKEKIEKVRDRVIGYSKAKQLGKGGK